MNVPYIWDQIVNNGVHQYPDDNHQVDDGELSALEDYQATDFISIFQKVKLALNLLVTFSMSYYFSKSPGNFLYEKLNLLVTFSIRNYFSTFPKDIKKLLPHRQ